MGSLVWREIKIKMGSYYLVLFSKFLRDLFGRDTGRQLHKKSVCSEQILSPGSSYSRKANQVGEERKVGQGHVSIGMLKISREGVAVSIAATRLLLLALGLSSFLRFPSFGVTVVVNIPDSHPCLLCMTLIIITIITMVTTIITSPETFQAHTFPGPLITA